MLKLENVESGYGEKIVLRGISLSVKEGEISTLIGANGAGKSTTLSTIMGMIPISQGEIEFSGRKITGLKTKEIVNLRVLLVPEGRKIFPTLSVQDNLLMGAYRRKEKMEQLHKDFEEVYELFPILKKRIRQTGGTLSGGEQQMLAIARGMMGKPLVLLLDEPSMGLAPVLVEEVFKILRRINQRGTSILLVEQNAKMALSTAKTGYILEHGEISLSDTTDKLIGNKKVKEAYLGII